MRSILVFISLIFFIVSCEKSSIEPKLGNYRAEMVTKDNSILPFKFQLLKDSGKLVMKVENDTETLFYDQIYEYQDSLKILMPPYDAVIIVKVKESSLVG